MKSDLHDKLIHAGESVVRSVRFTRDDIAAFARMSLDENPLHLEAQVAQRARFGEVIASGQHTTAVLMGMLATHYSRSDDGVARQMFCLNMNFAFKRPVFADQEISLQWLVSSVEWNPRLKGVLAHLDGRVAVARTSPAVVARGSILVTEPAA